MGSTLLPRLQRSSTATSPQSFTSFLCIMKKILLRGNRPWIGWIQLKMNICGHWSKNRCQNQSCRAQRELQDLSKVNLQELASLSCKSQNTFPEPAVWKICTLRIWPKCAWTTSERWNIIPQKGIVHWALFLPSGGIDALCQFLSRPVTKARMRYFPTQSKRDALLVW